MTHAAALAANDVIAYLDALAAYPSRRAPEGALLRMRTSIAATRNRLILRSDAKHRVTKDAPREEIPSPESLVPSPDL